MRTLLALFGGLLLCVIIVEALLAGLELFTPDLIIVDALRAGSGLPSMVAVAVSASWLVGSLLGGVMAGAVSGRIWVGPGLGLLLLAPAMLVGTLGGLGHPASAALALAPLIGACAGTILGASSVAGNRSAAG